MTKGELSDIIRQYVLQQGLSNKDIAALTGLHEKTIARIVLGKDKDSFAAYVLTAASIGYLPKNWRSLITASRISKKSTRDRAYTACLKLEDQTTTRWDTAIMVLLVLNIVMACVAIWVLLLPS